MSVSLDELVAVNDELAALVRAGVPLGVGLQAAGTDLPGRLGRLTRDLGERIERGQSLEQALAESSEPVPEVYRAVVLAGIKSGRLAGALELLAISARRLSELRRIVTLAMLYPLMLTIIAIGVFVFLIEMIVPAFQYWGNLASSPVYRFLLSLQDSAGTWGMVIEPLVISAAVFAWFWAGRSSRLDLRGSERKWRLLPSTRRIMAMSRAAALTENLGLLVEHEVPLHEAVRLACNATGDRQVAEAGDDLAIRLQQGAIATMDLSDLALPPRVARQLVGQRDPAKLGGRLKSLALLYHRSAIREADWLRYMLPTLLTVVVGGSIVLALCLTVFWPFTETMKNLAEYTTR